MCGGSVAGVFSVVFLVALRRRLEGELLVCDEQRLAVEGGLGDPQADREAMEAGVAPPT
jgi:hypothetical protein